MGNTAEDIKRLEREFKSCQRMLSAIGDETRARILISLLLGKCSGTRVSEIAKTTYLSRAAASHHIKVLKDAGIVKSRKEGKNVYYYLDPDDGEIDKLTHLFEEVKRINQNAPKRGEDD